MLETKRLVIIEFVLAVTLGFFSIVLTLIKFAQLPLKIPLWYTRNWGEEQLTDKIFIFIIPLIIITILTVSGLLLKKYLKSNETTLAKAFGLSALLISLLLYVSLFRIIDATSVKTPLPWFLEPHIMIPLGSAMILSFLLTPLTIKLANRLGLIDNPKTHKHPAMLLTRAVPRAGTTPVLIAIFFVSLIFVTLNRQIGGIFLAAVVSLSIGLIDDKYDLSPYIRFGSQIIAALIVIYFGLQITYINNPTGGVIPITNPNFKIDSLNPIYPIAPLAIIATLLWIIWTMNMLSWSNGVDGQFPGIVAVAAIVIGLLSIRDSTQDNTTLLSFITAGAVLGTTPFTWHKSHLLYGFGATSLGLILASLSILSGTKVATSLLVLMVPTLDAIFAIIRRLRNRQSPFWGDRAHFHHKLLDLGFSQSRIATFYWLVSIILGTIAVYSSGSGKLLAILTAAGIFSFLLIVVNVKEHKGAKADE